MYIKKTPEQWLETQKANFHKKYDIHPSGCWIAKKQDKKGYGNVMYISGRNVSLHRAAAYFFIDKSVLDRGREVYVCHKCDTPACCNPTHLFLGSPSDNQQDCIKKGRRGARKPLTWYTKYEMVKK